MQREPAGGVSASWKHQITAEQLLRMAEGDRDARDRLFERLYADLRRIASRVHAANDPGDLDTTDLIGAAYERLVLEPNGGWAGREHFLARAAIAMRQVVIDHLRERDAAKRGGEAQRLPATVLDRVVARLEERTGGLEQFDAALTRLRATHSRTALVVVLRVYGGLSVRDTAQLLGTSVRSVERESKFARAWLEKGPR